MDDSEVKDNFFYGYQTTKKIQDDQMMGNETCYRHKFWLRLMQKNQWWRLRGKIYGWEENGLWCL